MLPQSVAAVGYLSSRRERFSIVLGDGALMIVLDDSLY